MMLNDKIDPNINGSKEHRAKYTLVYFFLFTKSNISLASLPCNSKSIVLCYKSIILLEGNMSERIAAPYGMTSTLSQ